MVRRQLGRRLQRLRNAAQVSVDQLVANRELAISRAKLYRMESGQHSSKPQDIAVLCRHLGATDDETNQMMALALATRSDDDGRFIATWFSLYSDLEQIASAIHTFHGQVVPGIVQTADYARAVYRAGQQELDGDAIEGYVAARMRRQERFARRDDCRQTTVLDQPVLERRVGGEAVFAAQLERLREADRSDAVEIMVLPFSVGAHAAVSGDFQILDFDSPDDPNIVYVESQTGAQYLQKPEEYAEYQRIWDLIHRQSVPLKDFLR
ncbi:MAG: DUF5753 domain-containing protein [Micromonosporaceae bacterium]